MVGNSVTAASVVVSFGNIVASVVASVVGSVVASVVGSLVASVVGNIIASVVARRLDPARLTWPLTREARPPDHGVAS